MLAVVRKTLDTGPRETKMIFQCKVDYDPGRRYTRREMIDLIKAHQELLCFFAQASGYRRCVLGLDFDRYAPEEGLVPVIVMSGEQAKILTRVHGRRFKRAYQDSRPGRSVVITFTLPNGSGWFRMAWKLDEEHVFTA